MKNAKQLFDAAVIEADSGDLETALGLFKESLHHSPGRDSIIQNIAACYLGLHRAEELLTEIQRWRDFGWSSPTIDLLELRTRVSLDPDDTYSSSYYKYCAERYSTHPTFVSMDALLLKRVGNYEAARKQYRILKANSGLTNEDLFNYSVFNLLAGDIEEGIKYYECRPSIKANSFQRFDQTFVENSTRTISFYSEQGIGDQLLFFSLMPIILRNSDWHFQFYLDGRLLDLAMTFIANEYEKRVRFFPADQGVQAQSREVVRYGLCSLGSVLELVAPGALSRELTRRKDSRIFDLSRTPKTKRSGSLRIGVTWRSSSVSTGALKSAPIEDFFEGFMGRDLDIVNLQHDASEVELEFLRDRFHSRFDPCDAYDKANDFVKLTKSIEKLDAVFGVSNSTIHLAGYTNTPTFVFVPKVGQGRHWYWHPPETGLRWYRNVHPIERAADGKWDDLISKSLKLLNMET